MLPCAAGLSDVQVCSGATEPHCVLANWPVFKASLETVFLESWSVWNQLGSVTEREYCTFNLIVRSKNENDLISNSKMM